MTSTRPSIRWKVVTRSLLIAVPFTVMTAGFLDMSRCAWVLAREGKSIIARVTDVGGDRPGRRPKVWYQFEVNQDAKVYEHHDLFVMRTTGAHVSDEQWHGARRDRVISVIYWPSDPRVNAPAEGPPVNSSYVWPTVGAAFSACLAFLGWFVLFQSLRGKSEHT